MRYHMIVILVGGSIMSLAGCGSDETGQARDVSLLPPADSSATVVSHVLGRQLDLFAALRARTDIADLTMNQFTIRNDHHGRGAHDSAYAKELRLTRFLRDLAVRTPPDTFVLGAAGDLAAYRDIQAYPLSRRQIGVIAQRGDGATVLTSWLLDGNDWKAIGVVLNPSEDLLASMYDQSRRYAREQRS